MSKDNEHHLIAPNKAIKVQNPKTKFGKKDQNMSFVPEIKLIFPDKLISLNLSYNNILSFPRHEFMKLDFLSNLDVSFNKIKMFNLKHALEYPQLKMLNISGNLFFELHGVRHIMKN